MSLAFLEALSMAVWLNKTGLEQGEREKNESRAVVPSTLFTSMTFDEGSVDSVCEREFSKILSGVVVVFVHLEGIYKRKELGDSTSFMAYFKFQIKRTARFQRLFTLHLNRSSLIRNVVQEFIVHKDD